MIFLLYTGTSTLIIYISNIQTNIMQLYTNFEIAKAHTNNQVYKEIKAEGREEFTTE